MFYSRSLLSSKGPLGAIWVAAYCFKRLRKAQVFETNIPFSVDEILEKELDVMAYRVLAYLLLGLVRIYSKKVEYLFDDCHNVMIKINDFLVSDNKSKKNLESHCAPYYSITLPDSFELDAFDLGILEDVSGENVVPCEAITLKDGASTAGGGGKGHYSLAKYYCEEFASCHDICSADYAPTDDIFSSHLMEIGLTVSAPHDLSNLEASLEKLQSDSFAQEQRVNHDIFCGMGGEAIEHIEPFGEDNQTDEEHMKVPAIAQSENDMEKLQDDRFPGVEEEPLGPIKVYGEDYQFDGKQIKVPDLAQLENETCQATSEANNENITSLQAHTEKLLNTVVPQVCTDFEIFYGSREEPPKQIEPSGEEHQIDTEPMKFTETSSQNGKCQFMKREDPLSVSVDATPQSKFLDASGATTPEFMIVRTPATKEHARILRKRKCCFDDVTVFPNDVIRQCIQDTSDLVSKRRKVPQTFLADWKASQISNLSQGFLVPLLPCISLELRSLLCQEKLKIPPTKSAEPLELEFPTVRLLSEPMTIAPETPIGRSSHKMGIAPYTPMCISSEKMTAAPVTPTSRSSDKMVVAPDTPTCKSDRMAVALDTPAGRLSDDITVAPDVPTGKSSEQAAVTIETPISHSMASRSFQTSESHENACSIEAETLAHSYPIVKEAASSKEEDFDLIFMNELQESNSSEAEEQEPHGLSARTRMVAGYLHRRFLYHKKSREDEAVKLLPLLQGKSKKESARMFYEVLVLQTKGMVDVKQDDAYGDILIQKAPKWDQSCLAKPSIEIDSSICHPCPLP